MSSWSFLRGFVLAACSCTAASTSGAGACDESVDGQCSADSAQEPASLTSNRTCEPEDLCIVCNAFADDCKIPSIETLDANPSAAEVMGHAIGKKTQLQVQQRIDKRVAAGEKVQILIIGPNTWESEAVGFQMLFGDQLSHADIVFVDPIKEVLELTKKHAGGVNFKSVQALTAGAGDSDGSLDFWWYEPQCAKKIFTGAFEMDEEVIKWFLDYLTYWTSSKKESAMFGPTVHWLPGVMQQKIKNFAPEIWEQSVRQLNEVCLQEFNVPVLGPQSMMKASGFSFDGLDILHVDAEGMDTTILAAYLAQPGFDPAWIQFEWVSPPYSMEGTRGLELARVLSNLSEIGFDVHSVRQDMQVLRPLRG